MLASSLGVVSGAGTVGIIGGTAAVIGASACYGAYQLTTKTDNTEEDDQS